MKIIKTLALFGLICIVLISCYPSLLNRLESEQPTVGQDINETDDNDTNDVNDNDSDKAEDNDNNEKDKENNKDETNDEDNAEKEIDPREQIDLTLKPNEIGQVMVLMYHSIGQVEAEWRRTPENLRRDLITLYENDYRAISLKDFVNNNIDVEAGYTPVVITFDDGHKDNFNILMDDDELVIDSDCAIGIMEEFKKEYPDFNITATFFLNGSVPFRQEDLVEYKLNWLIENGYDVGNHTLNHNSMKGVTDPNAMQKYIGGQANFLESFLDGYEVNTYALCNGERPDKEYYKYLAEGSYEDKNYKNIAILEVGWDPSVSPVDKRFDPLGIHRVRASETKVDGVGMYDWLKAFDKGTRLRYISDGNPNVITIPEKYVDRLDDEKVKDKLLYIYK